MGGLARADGGRRADRGQLRRGRAAGRRARLLRRRALDDHPRPRQEEPPARAGPRRRLSQLRRAARQDRRRNVRYCAKDVSSGELDWMVRSIEILSREAPAHPHRHRGGGRHQRPDHRRAGREAAVGALVEKDRDLDWGAFTARIELVFRTFHEGWTQRDLRVVRAFLSDNLFQTQTYWVDAYKRRKLRNLTDGSRIVAVHLCRVISDARFDAITVRVFATGLDYTVNEDGAGGRRQQGSRAVLQRVLDADPRRRSAGAPRATPECPELRGGARREHGRRVPASATPRSPRASSTGCSPASSRTRSTAESAATSRVGSPRRGRESSAARRGDGDGSIFATRPSRASAAEAVDARDGRRRRAPRRASALRFV